MKRFTILAAIAVLTTGSAFASDPIANMKQYNKGNITADQDAHNVYKSSVDNGAAGNTATVKRGRLVGFQSSYGHIRADQNLGNITSSSVGNFATGNAVTVGH